MEKDEIIKTLISTGISTMFSTCATLFITNLKFNKEKQREIFNNYYDKFYTLWDKIHQGRAYNFSDLNNKQQEEIIEFFIETNRYQDENTRDLVYELKTNRFNIKSLQSMDICNNVYNVLIEKMVNEYYKQIKK